MSIAKKNIPVSKIVIFLIFAWMIAEVFIYKRATKHPVIVWDIWSYYAYLPVFFIEQDPTMSFMHQHPEFIQARYWPLELPNGNFVIKTSMGLSFIYLPFFIIGHLWALIHSNMDANGFSQPYQITIALCGSFSLLVGLLALRKFLLEYFSEGITALTLFLIIMGTNAAHYTSHEGAMSHIHNFMLIALFMRLTQLWHKSPSWKLTIQLGLLSGLIALVRPNNVIIGLFFILYNIYDKVSLKAKLEFFWKHKQHFLIVALLGFTVWIPQLCYWKYVTGHWFFHSYIGERFYFDRPRIYQGLFSYRKGWFLYTPMVIFALSGLFLVWRKAKNVQLAAIIFIILNIYVVFSWWCWWYGGGYSQRALIDSYPILAVGLASFLQFIFSYRLTKWIFVPIVSMVLMLTQFQTWQYKMGIIHWDSMTKELYWSGFLQIYHPKNYDSMLNPPDFGKAIEGKETD